MKFKTHTYIKRAARAKTLRRRVVKAILINAGAASHMYKVWCRNDRLAAAAIAEQERIARGSLVNAVIVIKTKWQLFIERIRKFFSRFAFDFSSRRSIAS